jgi:putative ABC transport system substrate-binding protein
MGVASIACPISALAQRGGKPYRLVILTSAKPYDPATGKQPRQWTAFFKELHRLGYDEPGNLTVTWHISEGDVRRIDELADQITGLKPDVIFSPDVGMARVLQVATASVPVVSIAVDPAGTGLAMSLARPGGNITGFSIDTGMEIYGKRIELLKQAIPAASRTAILFPRRTSEPPPFSLLEVVRVLGLTIIDRGPEMPANAAAYRRAFAIMAEQRVDSLLVSVSHENLTHRYLIAQHAIAAKLPAMFAYRENVEVGGLMSYGADLTDLFHRSAGYIDRILRGASPAEMPFQQPTKFELVINLRTANTLGVTLPSVLLALADDVID